MKRKELAGVFGLKRINMQTITPLTKAEKRRICEVCELIEARINHFSCSAINGRGFLLQWDYLRRNYGEFYEKDERGKWFEDPSNDNDARNLRIILLLLFAEVGKIEGTVEE